MNEVFTRCINLEFPQDNRRKATIVTNDKVICDHLAKNINTRLEIFIVKRCI